MSVLVQDIVLNIDFVITGTYTFEPLFFTVPAGHSIRLEIGADASGDSPGEPPFTLNFTPSITYSLDDSRVGVLNDGINSIIDGRISDNNLDTNNPADEPINIAASRQATVEAIVADRIVPRVPMGLENTGENYLCGS